MSFFTKPTSLAVARSLLTAQEESITKAEETGAKLCIGRTAALGRNILKDIEKMDNAGVDDATILRRATSMTGYMVKKSDECISSEIERMQRVQESKRLI